MKGRGRVSVALTGFSVLRRRRFAVALAVSPSAVAVLPSAVAVLDGFLRQSE